MVLGLIYILVKIWILRLVLIGIGDKFIGQVAKSKANSHLAYLGCRYLAHTVMIIIKFLISNNKNQIILYWVIKFL